MPTFVINLQSIFSGPVENCSGGCFIYHILTIYPNSLCMMFPTVCRIVQYCPAVYSIVQSRQFHSFNCEAKLHRQLGIFMDPGFNNGSHQKMFYLGQLTQMWVGGVGWIQTFISHCFMAYFCQKIPAIHGGPALVDMILSKITDVLILKFLKLLARKVED